MASEFFIVRSEYGAKDTQRYKPKAKALPPTDVDDVRDDRTLLTHYTPTHLNRIGSTPVLPLQSAPGTHAFSSSKKRLFPSSSPKLTPLTPPQTSGEKASSALDKQVQSLQATVMSLEKELSDAHRALQKEHKQKAQLIAENAALREHVDALTQRVADEREITTHQKKAFAKLSQKYVSVNESFHKLASAPSNETIKTVLATLARENQEHERRVRVLEAQHTDDKRSVANAEKRIKLLKAELEAIEHMQMTQQAPSTDLSDAKSSIHAMDLGDVGNLAPDDASRTVAAMIEHYIDPNLMRILHKVDSQFSISNAINLSTTMKRWLHACQSIHVSLDIGVVLEELLKKVVSVLQCEHAALFQLHGKKLICRCTNFGVSNLEIPADKGIVSYVLSSKTPCNLASAYDDPRFYSPQDNVTGITTRDIVCVPILDGRHDVLAVLRACNTTHYKGFSPNDEIVLSLFAVQAGILLEQFQMDDKLQASQAKLLRLHEMPRPLVSESVPSLASMSLIRFVLATERKFHDILGATKFKMFVLDDGPESSSSSTNVSATAMMWCVGTTLDPSCDTKHFRQYYKLSSGLCGVAMAHPRGLTVPTPFAHPKYNGAVDLNNLAHGLYVVPITSYWGKLLGVLQVARSATLAQGPKREVAQQQSADDGVRLHLLCIFAQTVAGILHQIMAHELYDACSAEIKTARWGSLEATLNESLPPPESRKASTELTTDEARRMREFVEKTGLPFHDATPTRRRPSATKTPEKPTTAHHEENEPVAGQTNEPSPSASTEERPTTAVVKKSNADNRRRSSVSATASSSMPVIVEDRRQSMSEPTGTATAHEFSPPSTPLMTVAGRDTRIPVHVPAKNTHIGTSPTHVAATARSTTPLHLATPAHPATPTRETATLDATVPVSPARSATPVAREHDPPPRPATATDADIPVVPSPTTATDTPVASRPATAADTDVPVVVEPLTATVTNVPVVSRPPTATSTEVPVVSDPAMDADAPVLSATTSTTDPPMVSEPPMTDVPDVARPPTSTEVSGIAPNDSTAASGERGDQVDDAFVHEYVDDPTLPPGWTAIRHGEHIYYEEPSTGTQTWTHPNASASLAL